MVADLLRRRSSFGILVLILVLIALTTTLGGLNKPSSVSSSGPGSDECNQTTAMQSSCKFNGVTSALKQHGVDGAFTYLATIYKPGLEFDRQCHFLGHKIGDVAYDEFVSGKRFQVGELINSCAYGFYHGFMETLIGRKGSLSVVPEFCHYLNEQMGTRKPDAISKCYYGFGHGVLDIHNPEVLPTGTLEALLDESITKCISIAEKDRQSAQCAIGVYNMLTTASIDKNGKYALKLHDGNPFWICRDRDQRFRVFCYAQTAQLALDNGRVDFPTAAKMVQDLPEDSYAQKAINSLAGSLAYRSSREAAAVVVGYCLALPDRLQLSCLSGHAEGLTELGIRQGSLSGALEFCRDRGLNVTGKDSCFQSIRQVLDNDGSGEFVAKFCQMLSVSERQYCPV